MKINYVVLVFIISFCNCYSQVDITYWGGCFNEKFFDVETVNNDIYVVGETMSFDTIYGLTGYGDILIFKNQGIHNNSWVKTLRGSIKLDRAIDIEIINDSSAILTGVYSQDDGHQMGDGPFGTFISKISSNGTIIWSKFFEIDNYFPVKVIATKSNELILLKFSFNGLSDKFSPLFYHIPTMVKIDDKGNIIQSNLFTVSQVSPMDYWGEVFDIAPANDTGYILMGRTNMPYYPYIMKVDENLNPIWYKVYKYDNMFENYNDGNTNNILTVNDGYIILGQNFGKGTTFTGPCLFKTDFNGNLKWFKEYNDPSLVKNLCKYGNNLYFTSIKNDRYWHITCLNLNGEIIWSKELGEEDEFYYYNKRQGKLISFQDTLYFIASSSKNEKINLSSPFGMQWDIAFLKFDTSQPYFNNFKNNNMQAKEVYLDSIHCDLYFGEFPISTVNAELRERNVSFDYDSIQCETLYLIDEINEKVIDNSKSIIIYPNPCKDYFYIDGDINFINHATLHVSDILGNLYISKYFESFPAQISLENLSKGVYIITVEANKKYYYNKIIVK